MKKLFTFLFFLLFTYTISFSQLTQIGAGPWQAFQNAGAPPNGWQTSCTTANWGNPVAGTFANQGQINCINNNNYSTAINGNTNLIWGPGGNIAYFKYCFTLDDTNGCGNYQLIHNVDDQSIIWVNGVQVDVHNGYLCNLHGNLDINPWLQCGENVIAVQATNNASVRYFVAELQFTNSPPEPLELSYDKPNCNDPIQFSTNLPQGRHRWTGPNGFTSTESNPVINPANSSHEGLYTCTVTLAPCCTQTETIYVTAMEGCCDENIIVERDGCFDFNFSLSDDNIDQPCLVWKDNGKVVGTDATYSNTLYGTHTICVQYFGVQKYDPNEVCCEERCVTVTTPLFVPGPIYDTIFTCRDQVWYAPQSCLDFDHYVMIDTDPSDDHLGQNYNYNSSTDPTYGGPGCDGWISHHLIHGNYIIEFFDENGCLKETLHLTVTQAPEEVHYQDYNLCHGECVTFDVNAPDFPCSSNNGILTGYTNILGYEGPEITICYDTPYRFETIKDDGCLCVIEGNITISSPPFVQLFDGTWCLGEETLDLSTLIDPCEGVFSETWEDLTANRLGFPPGPVVQIPGPVIYQDGGNIFQYGDLLIYRYRAYDEHGCLLCEYEITIQAISCFGGDNLQRKQINSSEDLSEATDLKIFPNPNTGVFTIQFSGLVNEEDWLKVYNRKGQLLSEQRLQVNQEMDISEYPDGLYFLHYGNGIHHEVKEVILQKDN